MANNYFTFINTLARRTLARSDALNALFQAIEVGFDRLPSRDLMDRNMLGFVQDTGAANEYAGSMQTPLTEYVPGLRVSVKIANKNTGPSTLNIDGLGAREIVLATGVSLSAGDFDVNDVIDMIYTGTRFVVQNVTRSIVFGVVDVAPEQIANAVDGFEISPDLVDFSVDGEPITASGAVIAAILNTNGIFPNSLQVGAATAPRTYVGPRFIQAYSGATPDNMNIQSAGGSLYVGKTGEGELWARNNFRVDGRIFGNGIPSEADAKAGARNDKIMTPLRTKQAMADTRQWVKYAPGSGWANTQQNTSGLTRQVIISVSSAPNPVSDLVETSTDGTNWSTLIRGSAGTAVTFDVPDQLYYRIASGVGYSLWAELK